MPKSCCSFGCSNHNMMHPLHFTFHKFPTDPDRRERWVNACRRVNPDGTKWNPGKHTVLCSAHFITGKPNANPEHPDYVPSVFSFDQISARAMRLGVKKISGYNSGVKRKNSFKMPKTKKVVFQEIDFKKAPSENTASEDIAQSSSEPLTYPCTPSAPQEMSSSSLEIDEAPVVTFPTTCTPFNSTENFKLELDDKGTRCDNVTCDSRLQEDAERRILYDEMYHLYSKKGEVKARLNEMEWKLGDVQLGAAAVEGSNEKCQLYTGVTWDVFLIIFDFLSKFIRSSGLPIELRDQLFLTLVKLRLNIPFDYLRVHAGVSTASMKSIFWAWVDLMASKLAFLIHRPDRETVRRSLPGVFKEKFPRLTSIIDCFEISVERSRNLKAVAKSSANLKKPSTVKVFIACTPSGSISFISSAWGGSVSDIDIVCQSDLISPEYHLPEDQILVNRAFTLQDEFAFICSAEVIIETFTEGRSQQSAQDVEISQDGNSVKKHVKRLTRVIKKRYTILQGTIPLDLIKSHTDEASKLAHIDKMLHVCAALINLSDRTVCDESMEYECKDGDEDGDGGNRDN